MANALLRNYCTTNMLHNRLHTLEPNTNPVRDAFRVLARSVESASRSLGDSVNTRKCAPGDNRVFYNARWLHYSSADELTAKSLRNEKTTELNKGHVTAAKQTSSRHVNFAGEIARCVV